MFCEKCKKNITNNNYEKHKGKCKGVIDKSICKYCGETWIKINCKSKQVHSKWCLGNPNRILTLKKLELSREKITENDRKKVSEKIKIKWEEGFYNFQLSDLRNGRFKGRKHTEETKEKIRKKAIEAIKNGKVIKAGRCKKIYFKSTLSGEFSIDGNWERVFCEWCDKNNIKLQRTGFSFEYIKPNKNKGLYYPDFKINNYFIEIKGYETELDKCKWSQFPEKLIILKSNAINELKNFSSFEDLKKYLFPHSLMEKPHSSKM